MNVLTIKIALLYTTGRIGQNFQNESFMKRCLLFEFVACRSVFLTKKLPSSEMFDHESAYGLKRRIQPHLADRVNRILCNVQRIWGSTLNTSLTVKNSITAWLVISSSLFFTRQSKSITLMNPLEGKIVGIAWHGIVCERGKIWNQMPFSFQETQGQIVGQGKVGTGNKKQVGEEKSRATAFLCPLFFLCPFRVSLAPLSAPAPLT